MSNSADLAIIGGGASAVLLLAALAKIPSAKNMQIDVYERQPERIARGIAYSTTEGAHLLNVRAANMSSYDDDKDHFARWAAGSGFVPSAFAPRRLYGAYLAEQFDSAKQVLTINVIAADVVSVQAQGDGYDVFVSGEGVRHYRRVVQATGNVSPQRPAVTGDVNGYYDDPWRADIAGLASARSIALVGSGLTAIDMVLALHAQGYVKKISIFSRHALPPMPHVAPASYPSFMAAADEALPLSSLLCLIRSHVRLAAAQNIPWQAVIDSLRSHTNPIWQAMDEDTRRRFLKRCFTLWNVHRHRMAPEIAQTLQSLQELGQVAFVKFGVNRVMPGPVVETAQGAFSFDAVINCLGYRYSEAGRSFDVWDKIGPARFGPLFETTAIPEIRAQASEIAQRIIDEK